jgi:hypothetical protein
MAMTVKSLTVKEALAHERVNEEMKRKLRYVQQQLDSDREDVGFLQGERKRLLTEAARDLK